MPQGLTSLEFVPIYKAAFFDIVRGVAKPRRLVVVTDCRGFVRIWLISVRPSVV
jgi:hypothetical protein